ncbi:serine hydrolase [soil metagenome]
MAILYLSASGDIDHEEFITHESTAISATESGFNTEDEFTASSLADLVRPLENLGPISSILIDQQGDLIAEEYFGSMHAERSSNIKSASKSILSILTGIAIDKGYLEGVDQQIGDFFPEYFNEEHDSVKASITIGDLLTMRSGLASTSRSNYGRWVTSSNWIRYALDRPLVDEPGVGRIYSTGNTHLLSVILTRATGMNTLEFGNRYLFGPMDIRILGWDRDPQGYYLGGNNIAMIPRDMVKIGRLMMDMGVYNNEQLVSGDWIVQSVEPVTGRRAGMNNYGYLWFRRMSGGYHMVYAFGNGGQYIMIIPELESVITVTTRNNSSESTRNYRGQLFSSIDREIIPFLENVYLPR